MLLRVLAGLLTALYLSNAAVPTPLAHFGYEPGTDYKLAGHQEIFDKFSGKIIAITWKGGRIAADKPGEFALVMKLPTLGRRNAEV